MLESVCPVEWRAARRRLCCVLVTGGAGAAAARRALRDLARAPPERLHYAYVYAHKQPAFIHALANGSGECVALNLNQNSFNQTRLIVISLI